MRSSGVSRTVSVFSKVAIIATSSVLHRNTTVRGVNSEPL
jgi:hypothetical protein